MQFRIPSKRSAIAFLASAVVAFLAISWLTGCSNGSAPTQQSANKATAAAPTSDTSVPDTADPTNATPAPSSPAPDENVSQTFIDLKPFKQPIDGAKGVNLEGHVIGGLQSTEALWLLDVAPDVARIYRSAPLDVPVVDNGEFATFDGPIGSGDEHGLYKTTFRFAVVTIGSPLDRALRANPDDELSFPVNGLPAGLVKFQDFNTSYRR